MTKENFDIQRIALEAMLNRDFIPQFPPQVLKDSSDIEESIYLKSISQVGEDLRHLLWSSIDNPDSKDLDQIEYCELLDHQAIRIRVGIADVDICVHQNSSTDAHAQRNTTSVYTGVQIFPMLPDRLSSDLTSLNEGKDRAAMVIDFTIDKNGHIQQSQIYPARVHNHAKLDYESVGPWLAGKGPIPERVAQSAALSQQLHWQLESALRLAKNREQKGALDLETIEPKVVFENGQVVNLIAREKNLARQIIENFMITANTVMSLFLEAHGVVRIQRVVRTPKRWERIRQLAIDLGEKLPASPDSKSLSQFLLRQKTKSPDAFPDLSLSIIKLLGSGEYVAMNSTKSQDGHFGLAVQDYTHSTAPNRRYPDLIMQRLVKALLNKKEIPYNFYELQSLVEHCTERQKAAKKVERFMRKVAAAVYLSNRIGESFEGFVTGVTDSGTYVRLANPPAEGRLIKFRTGLDVGDKVKVRLKFVDVLQGFIDFEQMGQRR